MSDLRGETVAMPRILFVCLGNICRSPSAEGVFRRLLAERKPDVAMSVDSAGTADYHIGKSPDPRACAAAAERGIDITTLRARQVAPEDFDRFDYILAMDGSNLADLLRQCPEAHRGKVQRLATYARHHNVEDVPDPYYGEDDGFEYVLDLLEDACEGLLNHVTERNFTEAR